MMWRVDRLDRNFYHIMTVAEELRLLGANIVSITEDAASQKNGKACNLLNLNPPP